MQIMQRQAVEAGHQDASAGRQLQSDSASVVRSCWICCQMAMHIVLPFRMHLWPEKARNSVTSAVSRSSQTHKRLSQPPATTWHTYTCH